MDDWTGRRGFGVRKTDKQEWRDGRRERVDIEGEGDMDKEDGQR